MTFSCKLAKNSHYYDLHWWVVHVSGTSRTFTSLVRRGSSQLHVLPLVWSAWIHWSSWAKWRGGPQPGRGPLLSFLSSWQCEQCTGWSFPVPSHQPGSHWCHSPTASDSKEEMTSCCFTLKNTRQSLAGMCDNIVQCWDDVWTCEKYTNIEVPIWALHPS